MGIYVYVQGWGGPYGGYNRSILLTYPKKQQVSTANPLILLHNLYNRVLYQGSVHDLFTGFANENRSQVASRTQALPQKVSLYDLPPLFLFCSTSIVLTYLMFSLCSIPVIGHHYLPIAQCILFPLCSFTPVNKSRTRRRPRF